MTKKELVKLQNLAYFTTEELKSISNDKENTLKKSVKRFLFNKQIVRLKKGIYVTSEFLRNLDNNEKTLYFEFIANTLKTPSYLSLEYVLTKYDILTESAYIHTSITTKNTNNYENSLGAFTYRSIIPKLFCGYEIKYFRDKPYNIAKKSKALFDYLYFRINNISPYLDLNLVEELRLKLNIYKKNDWTELEYYSKILNNQKMNQIICKLKTDASNNN